MDSTIKKKASRRKILKFTSWIIFTLFIIGGIYYLIVPFQLFKVKEFEIKGNYANKKSEIIQNLAGKINNISYIKFLGENNILFWWFGLPRINLNEGSLYLLNAKTKLFEKTIEISSMDREFYGAICLTNVCYGFDPSGMVFGEIPQVGGSLVLRINDSVRESIPLGENFLPNPKWTENLITTLNLLNAAEIEITEINLKDLALREWEVKTKSGPKIYFSLEFVPEKLDGVLTNLAGKVNFSTLNYLDLRVKNRLYYQ